MPATISRDARLSTLVHTHGTRLVRLAHLLEIPTPDLVAADALAATLMRRGSGDAHQELMTAAAEVGAQAQPPVHDEARLQGWLDRAELDPRPVDLMTLHAATVQRMAVQRLRRTTTRRRMAAAAVLAVAVVAGASFVDGGQRDSPAPSPDLATGSIEGYPRAEAEQGPTEVSGLLPLWPRRLPPGQRSATGVALADTLLAGPAIRVTRLHVRGAAVTAIAAQCAPRSGSPSLCALAVPPKQSLREAAPKYLLATLPLPAGDELVGSQDPVVSRTSFADEFDQKTVLWEVASDRVGTLRVHFTDGTWADATRYSHPSWDAALFVLAAARDKAPAELTYRTDGMILERRYLAPITS